MSLDLLSSTSRVETPFIIATIADVTFGIYSKESKDVISKNGVYRQIVTQYPNFMQSLNVTKINGSLNTYTLVMEYTVTQGDDPNLIEKVFSKAKKDRTIVLSYGDLSLPSYIYKEEEALITDVKSSIDLASSKITYTINCISKALKANAGTYSFQRRKAKPSDVIKEILYDNSYKLLEIFSGMLDKSKVLSKGLIRSDDREVQIEAKQSISILDYLKYLVKCMSGNTTSNNELIKKNNYALTIYDDLSGEWGGPYFKVIKLSTTIINDTLDVYEINLGYPDQNMAISFTVDDNDTYSILYDYSEEVNQSKYVYRIDNDGKIITEYSPTVAIDKNLLKTTEADKSWWTAVTQYPITATLTIKGLLRPALLMTYVKLNVLFFGQRHISSGYYIITKQVDTISNSGYRTVLSLTRIKGADIDY